MDTNAACYISRFPAPSAFDIANLIDNIDGAWIQNDDISGVYRALRLGYPAICGASRVGGNVIGSVLLCNVTFGRSMVFGCGAIYADISMRIPDGYAFHLRSGRIVRTIDEAMSCSVGRYRA